MGAIAANETSTMASTWYILGIAGTLLFYGRFYVQWIASERLGRSTVPVLFWYLSCAGTLALLAYAIKIQSPLGALGQCFNIIVYTRNIIHIRRQGPGLKPFTAFLLQAAAGAIVLVAIALVTTVWLGEYDSNRQSAPAVARQAWFWLGLGLAGQLLFAGRFLIQWIETERRGESTVPPAFWYLSLAAATLQAASFFQRQEWLFMAGMLLTLFIYARNIMLLKAQTSDGSITT